MERPVVVERLEVAGVPALHVRQAGLVGPAATVVLYHGWSSRKEEHRVAADALAAEGFRVIVPDAPRHGERDPFPDFNAPEANERLWDIVMQRIEEAAPMVTALVADGLVDPTRIGVVGSSMGGFTAAGVLARYPWARAAVLWNGNPCYEWLDTEYRKAEGLPPASAAEAARLREFDPEARLHQVAPKPLLMLHGEADQIVPIAGVRRFVDLARPLYRDDPDRLVLEPLPRLNHYVTVGMVESARGWFKRYL